VSSEKDYAGTPLAKKLGAKPGGEVLVFFTTSLDELSRRLPALKATLGAADGLWIAWPKKASKIETDLDFASVQGRASVSASSTTRAARSTATGRSSASSTASPTASRSIDLALALSPAPVCGNNARARQWIGEHFGVLAVPLSTLALTSAAVYGSGLLEVLFVPL
jgi:hypothetical protein